MRTEGKIESILKRQLILYASFIRNTLEALCLALCENRMWKNPRRWQKLRRYRGLIPKRTYAHNVAFNWNKCAWMQTCIPEGVHLILCFTNFLFLHSPTVHLFMLGNTSVLRKLSRVRPTSSLTQGLHSGLISPETSTLLRIGMAWLEGGIQTEWDGVFTFLLRSYRDRSLLCSSSWFNHCPSLSGLSTVTEIHTSLSHQVKSSLIWNGLSHQLLRANSVVPCPRLYQSQDPHSHWIPFVAVSGAVPILGHPPHPCSQNSTNQRKFQSTKCLMDASAYQANKKALHHQN